MFKRIFITLILMTALILAACNDDSNEEEDNEEAVDIPVEVAKTAEKDFTKEHTYIARTTPSDQMPVVPQGAGEVKELHVEEGDTVEEGDVLAEIKSRQYGTIELESPMDGMVQNLNMKVDRPVSTEDPAAMIIAEDSVLLNFSIVASDREFIAKDDEINYSMSAIDQEGKATVNKVAATAGEAGLFAVEAEIDTSEIDNFPIGTSAQVRLEEMIQKNALVVPTAAIVNEGEGQMLFKVVDNQAVVVDVELISMQSEETAVKPVIEGDLSAGDQVVITGQTAISDGEKVRIVGEDE
uniref:efflux RND transporter periplasmic adaptor subunit n=1 Tax=uncultured Allobacillus sp. TaxID=1638025 RepID=UPI0025949813|nr:DUF2118 domain-containing protein [uncultured Allobacillus sp.]